MSFRSGIANRASAQSWIVSFKGAKLRCFWGEAAGD